jgi:hypothetical protein
MASGFIPTNRALSRLLTEQARAIGVFEHPTAKGDGREDLLRDFLRERVGTTFGVAKAEIVDAAGASSHEVDAVVYDQSVASCLSVQGQRRIVRVESVAVAIEIRSLLKLADADAERERNERKLAPLVRSYAPTPFFRALASTAPETLATANALIRGVGALEFHQSLQRVVTVYFGYDGPAADAATHFARKADADIVCVLGKYLLARQQPGYPVAGDNAYIQWGDGDDALGALLWQLELALHRFREAAMFVVPNGNYYRRERPAEQGGAGPA